MLMVAGPVEIEKEVLEIGAKKQEYMRTQDYSKKWARIYENLKYIFQTKNSVLCFSSSGTGAMEACVANFFSRGDKILYVNAGTFGKRWGDIAKIYGLNAIELFVEFGKSPNPNDILTILRNNNDIKGVFATLNETSSGALQDIEAIGNILKDYNDCLFVVDCISGLCSDEFFMDKWNVDIAVTASQKALALPPGLSFLALNDKAISFARKTETKTVYFDILEYLSNMQRNQTPYTPATGIVEQLDYRLQKIRQEGLAFLQKRYKDNTLYLRENLKALGFDIFAETPANCVTGISTGKFDALKIINHMRNKFNIELAPSGGLLKNSFLRIGVYGNINIEDINYFLDCLKNILNDEVI